MTAPIPDHAGLSGEELRRRLWQARLSASPDAAMDLAISRAASAAEDAAIEVLESFPLGDTVKMTLEQFEYWRSILGGYDLTFPTGVRIGKRWTRTEASAFRGEPARRFILEYSQGSAPGFASVLARRVEISE